MRDEEEIKINEKTEKSCKGDPVFFKIRKFILLNPVLKPLLNLK